MMRLLAFAPLALAQCNLAGADSTITAVVAPSNNAYWSTLDSNCNLDTNGYANLDHDTTSGGFDLTIGTKESHFDNERNSHGATNGVPAYVDADKRYVIDCPQTAGQKTVKVTVTRPQNLTSFGAEWIQMFPKDSWDNVTNEYEPFTFNDYGSKIPLDQFRPQTDPCVRADGADRGTSDGEGYLATSGSSTTCIEGFTQEDNKAPSLNVFMEISKEGDYEFKYGTPEIVSEGTVGDKAAKWVAHEFKQTTLRVGSPFSDCDGSGATSDTFADLGVILPALYGNPNLEFDTYNSLIDDLTGSSVPVRVVLQIYGVALTEDSSGDQEFKSLDNWTESNVAGNGYTTCYRAGNGCPLNHQVCSTNYCNLDRWRDIITRLQGAGAQVLGHVETMNGTTSPNSVFVAQRSAAEIVETIEQYKNNNLNLDGWFFAQASGGKGNHDLLLDISRDNFDQTGDFVVFASGEPLFDDDALEHAGNPDVWVTLTATLSTDVDNMGRWTPFSWFADAPTKQWGAIVNNVPAASIAETSKTLFDRGYGWVYMHSSANFGEESSHTKAAIDAVEAKAARRLQEEAPRRLEEVAPHWGCDDTLFECRPVCLKTNGVTTSKVGDSLCADEPLDQCSCACYYDAHWTCRGDDVVCVATMQDEEKVVGDLVCKSRGTPKPEITSFVERIASTCEKQPATRGSWPAQECVDRWGAAKEAFLEAQAATEAPEPEVEETPEPVENTPVANIKEDLTIESFAAPALLAAVLFAQA